MTVHSSRRKVIWAFFVFALGLSIGAVSLWAPSAAQSLTPDELRALQGRATGEPTDTTPTRPTIQVYRPVVPSLVPLEQSQLERLYSQRAGRPLEQFGYDFLGVPSSVSIAQSGAIPDNYVLGTGDELVVVFRGQENSSYRVRLDRDGRVTLPKLSPIQAAGRTLRDFRLDIEAQVSQAFIATHVFVSLGEIHQLSVLVAGEVRTPGVRVVNALASPVDAILLSGGVRKTGSLRAIKLIRDGVSHVLDLYSILALGRSSNLGSLRDGDRIFVPSLGPTVAVAGSVGRPGIFELSSGSTGIIARSLVDLAGGIQIAGSYNLSKAQLERDGTTHLVPIQRDTSVRSGEVLFVDPSSNANVDRVKVSGAVAIEGTRPLLVVRTTADLFHNSGDLVQDAYAPFALVARRDPQTNALTLLPFSIAAAIANRSPLRLESYDSVHVFTWQEVRALATLANKNENAGYNPYTAAEPEQRAPNASPLAQGAPTSASGANGQAIPPPGSSGDAGSAAAAGAAAAGGVAGGGTSGTATDDMSDGAARGIGGDNNAGPARPMQGAASTAEGSALDRANAVARLATGGVLRRLEVKETDDQIVARLAATIGVSPDALVRVAYDNSVWVLDQVVAPGPYLAASGTILSELIQAAGGPTHHADLSSVEVTSTILDPMSGNSRTDRSIFSTQDAAFASAMIHFQDVIRLKAIYTNRDEGTVTVAGQVRYPGTFDITRDERLSSVLERAGGLTEVAYPFGAIFTRKDAAIAERQGNIRAAREIESQISSVLSSQQQNPNATSSLGYLTALAQRVRTTPVLGRVVVTADPAVLVARPELDVLLQPGDSLYIPKRPSSVTVVGEVLNPGSLQYNADASVDEYLQRAGGASQSAETSDIFVVLPDGSAIPRQTSWLSFGSGGHIPPGSTIVVPRDLHPFDWSQFIKDVTQVTSQLAVTAASLSVLGNN